MTFIEYAAFMVAGIVLGGICGVAFMQWYWHKGEVLARKLLRLMGG